MADQTVPSVPAQPAEIAGGAGLIGALKMFSFQAGLAVSSMQALTSAAESTKKKVEEAKDSIASVSEMTGGKQSAEPTMGSSSTLADVAASLNQQVGRR